MLSRACRGACPELDSGISQSNLKTSMDISFAIAQDEVRKNCVKTYCQALGLEQNHSIFHKLNFPSFTATNIPKSLFPSRMARIFFTSPAARKPLSAGPREVKSEVPFPFTRKPSQVLVPGCPDGVIAAMPLLEDRGIPESPDYSL